MADNINTISAQLADLEKLMTQRFNDMDKRLAALERENAILTAQIQQQQEEEDKSENAHA